MGCSHSICCLTFSLFKAAKFVCSVRTLEREKIDPHTAECQALTMKYIHHLVDLFVFYFCSITKYPMHPNSAPKTRTDSGTRRLCTKRERQRQLSCWQLNINLFQFKWISWKHLNICTVLYLHNSLVIFVLFSVSFGRSEWVRFLWPYFYYEETKRDCEILWMKYSNVAYSVLLRQ